MQAITKRLSELKHAEKNVRFHSDKQIKEYIRSIEMFGQLRPMVIDENDVVLAGNGLLSALKEMGRETADCYIVTGLTEKQKKKLMLADNKVYELGTNNFAVFDELLRELGGDVDIPGFDAELLETLTVSFEEVEKITNSPAPTIETKITQMNTPSLATPKTETESAPPNKKADTSDKINIDKFFIERDPSFTPRAKYATCPKCGERFAL